MGVSMGLGGERCGASSRGGGGGPRRRAALSCVQVDRSRKVYEEL